VARAKAAVGKIEAGVGPAYYTSTRRRRLKAQGEPIVEFAQRLLSFDLVRDVGICRRCFLKMSEAGEETGRPSYQPL
jgi:hypothetical protein